MKKILTGKVILGMLAVAAVLMILTLVLILTGRPVSSPCPEPASAAMTVIAAPTSSPRLVATQTILPVSQITPTALPGTIAIGGFVQITGTEGAGLRLRIEPNLSAEPLFLGYDSEVYRVVAGPVEADGHTWWKLTAPYDVTRTGWAVKDYLTFIQSP